MTLVERVAQWPEEWRREGLAQGRREGVAEGRREGVAVGRREGVAGQRTLLRRIASMRFGEAVGERIEALLGDTEDWDRLAAAADLIASAEREADLIDGLSEVVGQPG